ncbi:MAG TPA: DUF4124 domain-containing protein [Gammaproteobacteria bacterium]|nr:DUF4124 domain-containing protein [Gammaproteobacteria bacterium]
MRWWILVLLTPLAAAPAEAEIYKWRLPDGSIEYSDRQPEKGAERVDLPPLVTYTPPAASAPGAETDAESAATFDGYDSFTIASPLSGATVRDNSGNVTLNFAITPTLFEGHAIDIFMDGRKFGRSTAAVVTLSNVNRGKHQIYATLVDGTGAELARTQTITVDLLRVSDILSDEEKPPEEETPFDDAIRAIGGPKSEGGPVYDDPADPGRESGGASYLDPQDPGRKRRSGGAKGEKGSKSPGGPDPRFGATPTPPPPPNP